MPDDGGLPRAPITFSLRLPGAPIWQTLRGSRKIIVLPYPPSANRYWTQFVLKGRAMQAPSQHARKYKRTCRQILAYEHGIKTPLQGRLRIEGLLVPARPEDADKRIAKDPRLWDDTVRSIDLDNSPKVVIDSLQGILFENDKALWSVAFDRGEPDEDGYVVIAVEQIERIGRAEGLKQRELPL